MGMMGNSNAPELSDEEIAALVLHIDGLGDVQIAQAPLHVSRFVYSALLDLCDCSTKARRCRAELLKDTTLDIEQNTFWFYVLCELLRAGVTLPVVKERRAA